jgi:hypothetical protein
MPPLDTDTILIEEAKAIHGVDLTGKDGVELYRILNKLDSAALCLSGGGIRSASFALGVIQALAAHPRQPEGRRRPEHSLLANFHYLSTVSGGGYIGSWLTAWMARAGLATVWSNLVGRPMGPDIEPPVIAWLRSYSNYLTSKLGFTSADSWSAVAIVVRNLFLNWLLILPVFCLALLALKTFAAAVAWFSQFNPAACNQSYFAIIAAGCIALFLSLHFIIRNRPTRGPSRADQTAFLLRALIPASVSAVLFTFPLASPCAYQYLYASPMPLFSLSVPSDVALGVGVGCVIYLLSWLTAMPRCHGWKDCLGDLGAWLVAGATYGGLMALGV